MYTYIYIHIYVYVCIYTHICKVAQGGAVTCCHVLPRCNVYMYGAASYVLHLMCVCVCVYSLVQRLNS